MRHVDDAHHAEGDGKADRGEQQHAAEADPLEQILGEAEELEATLDRAHRALDGAAHIGIEIGVAELRREEAADLGIR